MKDAREGRTKVKGKKRKKLTQTHLERKKDEKKRHEKNCNTGRQIQTKEGKNNWNSASVMATFNNAFSKTKKSHSLSF